MRIVADTNTVLSGLLWQGPPRRLIDLARERAVTLCTSSTRLWTKPEPLESVLESIASRGNGDISRVDPIRGTLFRSIGFLALNEDAAAVHTKVRPNHPRRLQGQWA